MTDGMLDADSMLRKIDGYLTTNRRIQVVKRPISAVRHVGGYFRGPDDYNVDIWYLAAPLEAVFDTNRLNEMLPSLIPGITPSYFHPCTADQEKKLWEVGATSYDAGYIGRIEKASRFALRGPGLWRSHEFCPPTLEGNTVYAHLHGEVWVALYPNREMLDYAQDKAPGSPTYFLPLDVVMKSGELSR